MRGSRGKYIQSFRRMMIALRVFADGHYHSADELLSAAADSGDSFSRRTAQRILCTMEDAGIIEIHPLANGANKCYRLNHNAQLRVTTA